MVARGQGRARHPARMFKTIRNYLSVMMPSLMDWSARYGSLREVTRNDILDAVAARHGPVTRRRMVALRSLFRALHQERVVFRDPTRGISLPSLDRLPQPLLDDQVAGLLHRAGTEAARLAVALVAIHAATTASLAKIKLADLDLASARLTVKNRREQRAIYLDDVTLEVLSRWLRYRHERWPASPNPYLFVTQQTAVGTDPVSSTWFWILFEPLGIHPESLRQDRILDFTDRALSCTGRPPSALPGPSRTVLPTVPLMFATFACDQGKRACGTCCGPTSPRCAFDLDRR
jgi:hypothetical protein